MICDCIIFEIGKEPYVEQVETENQSVSFGKDADGNGVWRRIGSFTTSKNGLPVTYLYVAEDVTPPSKAELQHYAEKLKPKPYRES